MKLPRSRLVALGLAVVSAASVAACATNQSVSSNRDAGVPANPLTKAVFIGDSFPAGFGFCGPEETAKGVKCGVNQPTSNSWVTGSTSIKKCNPVHPNPDNRCSNNNVAGHPWTAGPWRAGPHAPTVAYSYQLARGQGPSTDLAVENWSISASVPRDWSPAAGGYLSAQTQAIKDSYVVMTLGANPGLGEFMHVRMAGIDLFKGTCASSTGRFGKSATGYRFVAGTREEVAKCFDRVWNENSQDEHLQNILQTLLDHGNKVLVVGYPPVCPWSFGSWQPNGNPIKGPAGGKPCTAMKAATIDGKLVTQNDQAIDLAQRMDDRIASVTKSVRVRENAGSRLAYASMANPVWSNHQFWSRQPWTLGADTGIHLNQPGHTEFAREIANQMCSTFNQWCNAKPY